MAIARPGEVSVVWIKVVCPLLLHLKDPVDPSADPAPFIDLLADDAGVHLEMVTVELTFPASFLQAMEWGAVKVTDFVTGVVSDEVETDSF